METEYHNVINAAKSWFRGVVAGARKVERERIIADLPPRERRLAQMCVRMFDAEKTGRIPEGPPVLGPDSDGRFRNPPKPTRLRLVK